MFRYVVLPIAALLALAAVYLWGALSSPFQKFAHVFSSRQFQWLALSPTMTHAGDEGIQI